MKGLYTEAKKAILRGEIDWLGETIKVVLVSSGYTVSLATHQWLSEIPSGARVATSAPLGGKVVNADAAVNANDVAYASVSATVAALVIYCDTGDAATSRLIYFDNEASPFPFNPAGSPVTIVWDNGIDKIFRI